LVRHQYEINTRARKITKVRLVNVIAVLLNVPAVYLMHVVKNPRVHPVYVAQLYIAAEMTSQTDPRWTIPTVPRLFLFC